MSSSAWAGRDRPRRVRSPRAAVSELAGSGALEPGATVVCEASSFQLEDTRGFAPEAAVLLNLAEDHLDRHGTLAGYHEAKRLAFARQQADDFAIAPCGLDE